MGKGKRGWQAPGVSRGQSCTRTQGTQKRGTWLREFLLEAEEDGSQVHLAQSLRAAEVGPGFPGSTQELSGEGQMVTVKVPLSGQALVMGFRIK